MMHLRNALIQKRKALSEAQQAKASQQVFECVMTLPFFQNSKKIAFYQAQKGEIQCNKLIRSAFLQNKQIFLPVLDPIQPNHLLFVAYQENDPLIKNTFGVEEPILLPEILPEKVIPACDLDLVFVPLVAFDSQHHRIGMGKGYYDRSFAFKKEKSQSRPLLVGLAYTFQKIADFTPDPWDVSMDEVIVA